VGDVFQPQRSQDYANDANEADARVRRPVRKGSGVAEEGGLGDGAANGDDEGGHHRFAVAGLKALERAEQNCGGQKEPALAVCEVIL